MENCDDKKNDPIEIIIGAVWEYIPRNIIFLDLSNANADKMKMWFYANFAIIYSLYFEWRLRMSNEMLTRIIARNNLRLKSEEKRQNMVEEMISLRNFNHFITFPHKV